MVTTDDLKNWDQMLVLHRPRLTRLATLAALINRVLPQYEARMEDWSGAFPCDVRGAARRRYVLGVERSGKRLRVYRREQAAGHAYTEVNCVFTHNPLRSGAHNQSVAWWILEQVKRMETQTEHQADAAGAQDTSAQGASA